MLASDDQTSFNGDLVAPQVSLLVVSWNTCELTLRCLDSIPVGIDDDLTYEVVVVDNGSRDRSAERLAERSDIKLIVNPDNRGYAVAVNQTYAASSGELVLLLNSDILFQPGSLSTLVRFLRERPDVAGVGPLYLNPDLTPQQHHYRLPTFASLLANTSELLGHLPPVEAAVRRYRMLDDDFSAPRPVPQPSASCLLLRRSVLPEHHLLDEQYPVYFNDVALALSLNQQGHQLWMTPRSVVVHEHGASTRLLGGKLRRQYLASLMRYLAQSQPQYRRETFRWFLLAQGLAARLLRRPESLPPRDLWGALQGDPGHLPQAPSVQNPAVPAATAT
jgi:GT2 family glycosyltransferase